MKERRAAAMLESARMSTQRNITYLLIALLAAVTATVFAGSDQAERSTVLQTIINLVILAVGFWLGSSKSAADKDASISRIAEASAPTAAAAVAAVTSGSELKAENVNVEANTATITTEKGKT